MMIIKIDDDDDDNNNNIIIIIITFCRNNAIVDFEPRKCIYYKQPLDGSKGLANI